jgi:hypothetical protein
VDSSVLYNDGERIIVRTNYGVLLKHMLYIAVGSLLLIVLVLGANAPQYADPSDSASPASGIIFSALVACIAAFLELRAFARLVRRNPALLVNADGIVDRCSRFVYGRGLLPWRTIMAVELGATYGSFGIWRYLAITLMDESLGMLSQSPSQDLLETDSFLFKTHVVRISQGALGIPVADFLYVFERYLNRYSGPDWQDAQSDEEDEEDDADSENYDDADYADADDADYADDADDADDKDEQLPDNYSTPWSS